MPAVTLQHSTTHSSQNCGVLIALAAVTFAVVTSGLACDLGGVAAVGLPARRPGTRTVNAPSIMTTK